MSIDKTLLRAEQITDLDFVTRTSLLPSQMEVSGYINDYIKDPTLSGYSFYLTGLRGSGKTHTAIYAVAYAKTVDPSTIAAVVTFNSTRGFVRHPSFHQNLADCNLILLNDEHYHLEAIRDGKLDREREINSLIKLLALVQENRAKSIVVTDTPLHIYADQIGDKKLSKVLKDSYFLNPHELFTGGHKDLVAISENYSLKADDRLLWNIHHTRPNIRYLLAINYLYGNAVTNFNDLVEKLKQESVYQEATRESGSLLKLLFNKPEIRSEEDVHELIENLKRNEILKRYDNTRRIDGLDDRLLEVSNGVAYVPTTFGELIDAHQHYLSPLNISYDLAGSIDWKRENLKKYWRIREGVRDSDFSFEYKSPLNDKYEKYSFTFVLADPVYDVIMPRIVQEGIQIR